MDGQSFKDAIELIEFMIGEGTDYWLRNANSKMRWMKKQRLSQEQRDQLKPLAQAYAGFKNSSQTPTISERMRGCE